MSPLLQDRENAANEADAEPRDRQGRKPVD